MEFQKRQGTILKSSAPHQPDKTETEVPIEILKADFEKLFNAKLLVSNIGEPRQEAAHKRIGALLC